MTTSSKQKLVIFLATFGYLGKSPKAPGTVGSVGALLVWWLFSLFTPIGYVVATVAVCVCAIWISNSYENLLNTHDASEIVIDEVAGMLIALALLPITWKVALLGFLIFRFFDVLKPFPIGMLDKKVSGGFGVVVDDLMAGLMTNILLQLAWQYYPQLILV